MSSPPTATDDEDLALMVRVQAGETDAFGALYDRFSVRAYRMAYGIANNSTQAEDIVQEAFFSVWRTRAQYRPDVGSVGAWVMTTVRRRAIDALRTHSRHDSRRADEGALAARPEGPDVEETTCEREDAARLRATLAQLPAAQRDVIALAFFGELSTSEIAAQLDLPLGTVKGRMRLGLDKLRTDAP